jgi:hypothetical protein
MKDLGLSIVDRRKLDAFRQTERVRNVEDVEMEEVMTEPERQSTQRKSSSKARCICLHDAVSTMATAEAAIVLVAFVLVAIVLVAVALTLTAANERTLAQPVWRYGALHEACSTVCSSAGMECEDGDWGVHDEQSVRVALEAAGQSPDALCTLGFYSGTTDGNPSVNLATNEPYGSCWYMEGSGSTSCSQTYTNAWRLCRCV